jgi:hypothetical protein
MSRPRMARRTSKSLTRSPPPDEAACGPAGHRGACTSRCIPRSVAGAYARVAGCYGSSASWAICGSWWRVCRCAVAARRGHRAPQPRPTSGTRYTKDSAASIRPAWRSGPAMWNSGFMGCWSWPLRCLALPWQRWWLTAKCRRCPALARRMRRYRAPASRRPGVVPSPPSASSPRGVRWRCAGHETEVTRDGTWRRRGEDTRGLVREAGRCMTHKTDAR